MSERLIRTINGSGILEHHVPSCCEVKSVSMNTTVVCKKEKGCTVKVCYFRNKYEDVDEYVGTTPGVIKNAT